MENIIITPFDSNVKVMAQTVQIINEFKKRGFETRGAFMQVVGDHWPDKLDHKTYDMFGRFWLCRLLDANFVNKMNDVLEQLKEE